MTQGPDDENQPGPDRPEEQQPSPEQPGYEQPGYEQPGYEQPGWQQGQPPPPPGWQPPPLQGWQPPPPGWAPPPGQYYPPHPAAPYGVHPVTGVPYSDKSRIVAGVLQLVIPLGIGRFYMGYTGLGVAQLLVTIFTCGIGAIWPFIDGILILVNDDVTDAEGRPLRSS